MTIQAFHNKGKKNIHIWISSVSGFYKSHRRAVLLTGGLVAAIAAGYYIWNHRREAYVKKKGLLSIGGWTKVEDTPNNIIWVHFSGKAPFKALIIDKVKNAIPQRGDTYFVNEARAKMNGNKLSYEFIRVIKPGLSLSSAKDILSKLMKKAINGGIGHGQKERI